MVTSVRSDSERKNDEIIELRSIEIGVTDDKRLLVLKLTPAADENPAMAFALHPEMAQNISMLMLKVVSDEMIIDPKPVN